MSKDRSVVKSTFWSVVESGGLSILSLVSLVLLAKLLTPSDFGAFSIALSVVEIIGLITGMLLHDALIQKGTVDEHLFSAAFCGTVMISGIAVVGLYLIFPLIAAWVGDPRVSEVGRVLAASILFSSPANILAARLKREFNFKALALRSMLGRISGLLLGLLIAWQGGGIWALVVQYFLMTVAGALFLIVASRRHISFTLDMRGVVELLPFSINSIISYFCGFSAKRIFTFLIGVSIGTYQAGLLNLAFRIADTLWAITANAVSQVMLPMMSRRQDDRHALIGGFKQSIKMSGFLLFPVFIGLGAISGDLVQIVFGEQWVSASGYVTALSFLIVIQIPRVYCVPLLNASGYVKEVRNANVLLMLFVCGISGVFSMNSAWAGVLVWFGCELLLFALLANSVCRKFTLASSELIGPLLPSIVGAGIMFGVVLIAGGSIGFQGTVRLTSLIFLGAGVYVLLAWWLERETFKSVLGLFPKLSNKRSG